MSIDMHDEAPDSSSEISLAEAVREFDNACHDLFKACRIYSHIPVAISLKSVYDNIQAVIDAWTATACSVLEDESLDLESKASMVATLAEDDNQRRGEYFKKIIRKEYDFGDLPEQEALVRSIVERLSSDDYEIESCINQLEQDYHSNLDIDLKRFIEQIELSPRARSLKAGKTIGKHAVEVAKVGVGVWAGLKLSQRFDKI